MYNFLLALHSATRWLVLLTLIYAIYRSYRGWLSVKLFTKHDGIVRAVAVTVAHIQFMVGLGLYFLSPIIRYFFHNFSTAVHNRDIRFFGMEHALMMFIAIVFITIGSSVAKRQESDVKKFKTMAIWFTVALLIILISIPWPFSPFSAHRSYFRSY
jgi:hypothetical protein